MNSNKNLGGKDLAWSQIGLLNWLASPSSLQMALPKEWNAMFKEWRSPMALVN